MGTNVCCSLVRGKILHGWIGNPTWFPAFRNLFRKNDTYENYEAQTNQAAGVFLRWLWKILKQKFM